MTTVDNTNLFVGNFSWNLSEDDMRELFAPYGELEDVKLIIDRMTGRSKGFGFVKFVNEEDAAKALEELNDKEVDGREMKVTVARPREERPERNY
ncbi:MAG TPA: RNA-binding protein [Candidatus Absconditabacterales bacterium]|nr:RNA-binding protein [Candidatus Absconditabacterales bacterium]